MENNLENQDMLNPQKILKDELGLGYGEKVADLGCGPMGFFIIEAARIVADQGTAYAVDVLKEALSSVEGKARIAGLNNLKTIWSDLEKYGATQISPDSLDACMIINTLFQTKDQITVIKEAVRLLKVGGKLLIIEWLNNQTPFGPAINIRIAPQKIKEIAASINLKVIKEFTAGNYHYGIIFKK